jgi:hypothetical protein
VAAHRAALEAASRVASDNEDGDEDDDNTCTICYARPLASVFVPCKASWVAGWVGLMQF